MDVIFFYLQLSYNSSMVHMTVFGLISLRISDRESTLSEARVILSAHSWKVPNWRKEHAAYNENSNAGKSHASGSVL